MASKPSKAFYEAAGTGEMHSKVAGEEKWTGELKYLGYNEQELITVKP
jgi:hypothetical protein